MMRRWRPEILAAIALSCVGSFIVATSASNALNANSAKTRQAALSVGVKPPWRAPRFLKRLAWRLEKRLLQVISWFDPCSPPDSKLSLRLLWWKAVAANDASSPVFENNGVTLDMLPGGFRILLREPLRSLIYPRWTHVIIEIRTAYLDQVIGRIRNETIDSSEFRKLKLISMGGGYDARSVKLQLSGVIDDAVELDLSPVIKAKEKILARLCKRRPDENIPLPTLYEIDLTQVDEVETTLVSILKNNTDSQEWYNVFLFEGVLMYLPEGVPCRLLQACRRALDDTHERGSIVFSDELENIPNDDIETARQELAKYGWNVVRWQPKGGRTRHMGCLDML
jgi:hypothetical protein